LLLLLLPLFFCITGWARAAAANSIPYPCDKGTYSTGGTEAAPNAACTVCPAGYSTQEDESTNADECAICKPGHGGAGCAVCPVGTFASGGAKVGDACQDCAVGSTSKSGATQSQQCYSKYIDARNDVYNVADEGAWTAADAAVNTATACQALCTDSCVMYKFTGADGSGKCSTYAETASGATVQVGFKIGNGDDYAVWGTAQKVGAALAVQPTGVADEAACKAACSASSECEVYNWGGTTCSLTKSELEEASISMFQVVGSKLFSNRA
jgi:hypothetical protein